MIEFFLICVVSLALFQALTKFKELKTQMAYFAAALGFQVLGKPVCKSTAAT